ncbi:MAG: hypothetical protein WBW31_08340 [Candidatus Sulfotelmatobacter sp.]|jgi:hypothetical protein
MSTAAISSSSIYQQTEQYFQTRQSDLQQLGQALQSGDLADAQTAYNNIIQLGQSGPFASGDPFSRPQREQDFTAIGQALQSGDLAGAQAAFSTLQSTFEKAGTQNSPSASSTSNSGPEIILNLSSNSSGSSSASSAPASSSGPEIILNLGNSNGTASPEQITINLNPTSGGGEQVSLSVGSQGSNAQEITFNLPPNSNEQIVLNLLGESSTSSSSNSSGSSSVSGGLSVSA